MQPLNILGIYRHPRFSNNAIEADRLILEESLSQLRIISPQPLRIEMAEESEADSLKGSYSLVLTMAQSEEALRAIDLHLADSLVWNSSAAIRQCYRKNMSRTLGGLSVGYVPFQVIPTDGSRVPLLAEGCAYWLKRSDFHAIQDEDVTLAESPAEVKEKLARFQSRGVGEVILQRHVHGDIYKFYGVKGHFFRAFRVRDLLSQAETADTTPLERMAAASADALGLMIYGGDAILDESGRFHLIDVNDWPSFRICRDAAALAIASLCAEQLSLSPESRRKASILSASLA